MAVRPLALLCAVIAYAVWVPAPVRADIEGEQFESAEWRVRMTAPKNWQLTEKTAYPNVLLQLVRRMPDGKMMLTAERLPDRTDALRYAEMTIDLLRRMRFRPRAPQLHSSTGAYFIDARRGPVFVRQAFLVAGGVGYSLSLAAPDNRTRSQHLRAFDETLRSLRILRPDSKAGPKPDSKADPTEDR